jgi:hypothetical protein
MVGCPIRRSRDQRALAPPPSFSQRATSFIASRYQGIHQMPFSHSPTSSPQRAKVKDQMSDDRCQTASQPGPTDPALFATCHRPSSSSEPGHHAAGIETCAFSHGINSRPESQRHFPGAHREWRAPFPVYRSRQRPAVTHTHARTRRPLPSRLDSPPGPWPSCPCHGHDSLYDVNIIRCQRTDVG